MDDVAAVVTDLFFQSRISSAARYAGRSLQFLTSLQQIRACTAELALVDLDSRVDAFDAIRTLKEAGVPVVIAFGPHLDTERRKAARSAGANRVLAKSKFVIDLPEILERARHTSEHD